MVLKTIFPGCGVRASLMLFFFSVKVDLFLVDRSNTHRSKLTGVLHSERVNVGYCQFKTYNSERASPANYHRNGICDKE